MKIFCIHLFASLIALSAHAQMTIEKALSFRWDSLRFALGVLQSDSYSDQPVIVIYKTKDGAKLLSYDISSTRERTLNQSELADIISQLKAFFTGATPPTKTEDHKIPSFFMLLDIDSGFSRQPFERTVDPDTDVETIRSFSRFIESLFSSQKAQQD